MLIALIVIALGLLLGFGLYRAVSPKKDVAPTAPTQPVTPAAPKPVTPAPHPNATDLMMRPNAEQAAILDARAEHNGDAAPGWTEGYSFDAFGVGHRNPVTAGKTLEFNFKVPAANYGGQGFEFKWSSATTRLNGTCECTVLVGGKTYSGGSGLELGSVRVKDAPIGADVKVLWTGTSTGEEDFQIDP